MGNHPLGDDPHWPLLSCLHYHGPLAQGHPLGLDRTKGAQHLLYPTPQAAGLCWEFSLPLPACLKDLPFAPSEDIWED